MEHAISIKLTHEQYHILKALSKEQYRTLGNTFSMLAAYGLGYWLECNETFVKKEGSSEEGGYSYYRDSELKASFDTIPLNQ